MCMETVIKTGLLYMAVVFNPYGCAEVDLADESRVEVEHWKSDEDEFSRNYAKIVHASFRAITSRETVSNRKNKLFIAFTVS